MNPEIFAAILDTLRADATLIRLLGGPFVYRAKGVQPSHIPSVTLLENNEPGTRRVGYNTTRRRDNSPTLQVDVWIATNQEEPPCTGEDADWIAERLDTIVFSPVPITGTRNWAKVSGSTQNDEDIGGIHISRRYSFDYSLIDT